MTAVLINIFEQDFLNASTPLNTFNRVGDETHRKYLITQPFRALLPQIFQHLSIAGEHGVPQNNVKATNLVPYYFLKSLYLRKDITMTS